MNIVLRQEHKYQLSYLEYKKLRARLQMLLPGDPHNGLDGYTVRSLYFDTLTDTDYQEKLEGIEKRRKLRLRIYHADDPYAMLEMKQKQGIYQLKRSLRLRQEDALRLARGDYAPLLGYADPFAAECFAFLSERCYRPKSVVQYQRYAFIVGGNNTRVTLDHSLVATEACLELFAPRLNMYPVQAEDQVTLEVKYKDFLLQPVKDEVNRCNKADISISKYALSRRATLA